MPRSKKTVVVYFRWRGKRYSASGKTRDEAIEAKTKKIAALESGYTELSGNTLVRDWISEWLETYKRGVVNDSWFKAISGMCNNYILPELGNARINRIKPVQLQKIINSNHKSKSFNKKLFDIIRQIFRSAYLNGLTPRDISESLVPSSSGVEKKRRSITDHERAVLLNVLEEHRGKLLCYLMLYAGLRPGEAAALQWRDIDFRKRQISISKALKSDGTIQPEPKTKAGRRSIPLQSRLFDVLYSEKGAPFDFVCTTESGGPYSKKSIQRMWKSVRRLMDLEMGAKVYRNQIIVHALPDDFYLYNLRHTFCTDLQAAGIPINVARELMGHESISITAEIYTHHSDTSYADALRKMENYTGNSTVPPQAENY
ncbi:tyrosine-type recombinase/integrase [Hornefia butyriciproducens]|uniref:tyrosine-type recombinase/integrase n=1 Tax=Hornefia butyriciproducens TaxID=2652293 RepID=UPI003F8970D6